MPSTHPFHQFQIGASSYLARSVENLERFENEGMVTHFFYAALDLRFGIEARLNEYLRPALKSIGKDRGDITEYVATKLLKRLTQIDPEASRASTLRITSEQSGRSTVHQFTPVSQRLASIHGQLGEILHYQFFNMNEHWYLRKPLGGNPHRSIADFVGLVKEGITELQAATAGTLLSNPSFTALVEGVASEASETRDEA